MDVIAFFKGVFPSDVLVLFVPIGIAVVATVLAFNPVIARYHLEDFRKIIGGVIGGIWGVVFGLGAETTIPILPTLAMGVLSGLLSQNLSGTTQQQQANNVVQKITAGTGDGSVVVMSPPTEMLPPLDKSSDRPLV